MINVGLISVANLLRLPKLKKVSLQPLGEVGEIVLELHLGHLMSVASLHLGMVCLFLVSIIELSGFHLQLFHRQLLNHTQKTNLHYREVSVWQLSVLAQ